MRERQRLRDLQSIKQAAQPDRLSALPINIFLSLLPGTFLDLLIITGFLQPRGEPRIPRVSGEIAYKTALLGQDHDYGTAQKKPVPRATVTKGL